MKATCSAAPSSIRSRCASSPIPRSPSPMCFRAMSSSPWAAGYSQFIDPDPAVLANADFRKPPLYAIDRKQLADTIQLGKVPVVDVFLPTDDPNYQAYLASVPKYPYDARKATQMIQDLGFTKRPDGFFYDANGKKLAVEQRTTSVDDAREKSLLVIADQWKSIGVDAPTVIIARQQSNDQEYRITRPAFELVN